MPLLIKALPKYRKHKASGQAIVTLNGRDHYLGPYGTKVSRQEYDRLVCEWLASGRTLQNQDAPPFTIVELCAKYLVFAKQYYVRDGRCTGVIPGIKAAMKYLLAWYRHAPVLDFGPLALKALRQRMVEDGLSRSYVNDHIARIKRIFKLSQRRSRR